MTTETQIMPTVEVSVVRDGDAPILVIDVVDGEGNAAKLRYSLPQGGGKLEYRSGYRSFHGGGICWCCAMN